MENMMGEILSQLDYRVVYVVVAILIVSAILAIIKKAIGIAILVGVLAFGISFLGPMAKQFQADYKFDISSTGVATIQAKGNMIKLGKDEVKSIDLVNKGVKGYVVNVTYTDGVGAIKVPTFMMTPIRLYAEKQGIPVKLIE